jgi:hypothetical protein
MFGLFKDREPEIKVIDKVWMSAEAKFKACAAMAALNSTCIFIAWFEQTYKTLSEAVGAERILLAQNISNHTLTDKMIVFAEHHPLSKKEFALFSALQLKEVPVLSSLDEPFFMWFGGEKTILLMKKLGMNENEVIGSNLITKSIRNAQQKIEKQVPAEREARSQQEWLMLNLPHK